MRSWNLPSTPPLTRVAKINPPLVQALRLRLISALLLGRTGCHAILNQQLHTQLVLRPFIHTKVQSVALWIERSSDIYSAVMGITCQ
jgi:hypothetical protein